MKLPIASIVRRDALIQVKTEGAWIFQVVG